MFLLLQESNISSLYGRFHRNKGFKTFVMIRYAQQLGKLTIYNFFQMNPKQSMRSINVTM